MDAESQKKQDAHKKSVGKIGEEIAANHLQRKGFSIVARNYRKKWGEIDIIAQKGNTTHFFEVKTISCEMLADVSREPDRFNPEDNIHPGKIRRLVRAAETFMAGRRGGEDHEWQFDAIAVFLDQKNHTAAVRVTEHIA